MPIIWDFKKKKALKHDFSILYFFDKINKGIVLLPEFKMYILECRILLIEFV